MDKTLGRRVQFPNTALIIATQISCRIQKFEGTVILVTHDEDLVADSANRIWHLDGGNFTDFKGSYEEFQAVTVNA